jgi:hypothetical protein
VLLRLLALDDNNGDDSDDYDEGKLDDDDAGGGIVFDDDDDGDDERVAILVDKDGDAMLLFSEVSIYSIQLLLIMYILIKAGDTLHSRNTNLEITLCFYPFPAPADAADAAAAVP